jgi:hypothetical protein
MLTQSPTQVQRAVNGESRVRARLSSAGALPPKQSTKSWDGQRNFPLTGDGIAATITRAEISP